MNITTFPLLNLEVNIKEIAFSIGNVDIYWYAILICIAIVIDLIMCKKKDGFFGIKFDDILD